VSVHEMSSRHAMVRRGEKSAVAAVCYITGSSGMDERTGQGFSYSAKGGVEASWVMLPEGAPSWMKDPVKLMAAAELYEDVWAERRFRTLECQERHKATAMIAHTAHYSLHNSLKGDPEAQKELISRFVEERYTSLGLAAVIAIHDEPHNLHFHVQVPKRVVENNLEGFGVKAECFRSPVQMGAWAKGNREAIARLQNERLRSSGQEGVVEHRSLAERGLEELEATRHLGERGQALEERGEGSRAGEENREIEASNREKVLSDPGLVIRSVSASRAVFTKGHLAYEVSRRMGGDEALETQVMKAVMEHPELVALEVPGDEVPRYSSKTYREAEQTVLSLGERMGQEERFTKRVEDALEALLPGAGLNAGQEEAAWACVSPSRLVMVQRGPQGWARPRCCDL
jgi:hypothetical protein